MSIYQDNRSRNVTAVLGPTNTGKTHLAIERMLGHDTGLIGLPLRLLAREVYDKIAARIGADKVALITGEEKIKPEGARYWVCTVEAMPRDINVDFLAIDEIQLAADPERGHVFTDRLLHARGNLETLLLGAGTMRETISELIPGANFISRPRLSKLSYAGEKKITRLPPRSAIVSFSASEVYAVAELIRRQRGGAAVVIGALSPRTRNAQVALYQSGDVDFIVATDAIGMGLNLDVDHVAFSATRKFDGQSHRDLTPGEMGQIAGRAGRHMNDGTFGVTGGVESLNPELVERLENHTFDQIKTLQWRTRGLDFGTLDRLRDSLRDLPKEQRLTRARMADDVTALETVSADREVSSLATSRETVTLLWELCQIPDYRRISTANHAELVATLYKDLLGPSRFVDEDWFAKQVAFSDRTDGDIDTLSNRLAHIRTWTFVANRNEWLKDPQHWQARTREIEDQLSDALHERLTQRFVDRRTSALMKGMRDKEDLYADIAEDGAIHVEKHFVGRLKGFRFTPDAEAEGIHGKAARSAAAHVLIKELEMRARRVASAKTDAFKLTRKGIVTWRDEEIAQLGKSDDPLKPTVEILCDEHLTGPDKERIQERLNTWVGEIIGERLKSLVEISKADDISGLARGIAFRMTEQFGVLQRETVAEDVRTLDQAARAQLRKYGVRFGAFNIFFPPLLKPAAADLALTLWTLSHATAQGLSMDALPDAPRAGLTSVIADKAVPDAFYRAAGFHLCGPRAVRVDMLERLADLIRPLCAWKADPAKAQTPPKGATGDGGFTATPEMMSILGCSADELGNVLKALGFRLDRREMKPAPPAAPTLVGTDGAPVNFALAAAMAASAATEADAKTAVPAQPEDAAPVEKKFIEIWRPRRHGQHQHQHRGERGRRNGTAHGDGTSTAKTGESRRNRHKPAANPANTGYRARDPNEVVAATPALAADGTVVDTNSALETTGPDNVQRPNKPGFESRGGFERKPGRDGAPGSNGSNKGGNGAGERRPPSGGGFQARDARDNKGPRDNKSGFDRKGGRDRDERPSAQYRAAPPSATRGAVVDSPFAALSQLKAALEKSKKE
jgi:ATP-dependent RNA helicase SUPV3L1/SUV3